MMKKRGTYKPCPGCGGTDWRETNSVCMTCRRTLQRAKEFAEQQSNMGSGEVVVEYGYWAHFNQHLYRKANHYHRDDFDLQAAFQKLAIACSTPTKSFTSEFALLGKVDQSSKQYAIMSRAVAESIRDLYAMMQPVLTAEYEQGKKDGHNLLMRLAKGDLSPNEYMEKTDED